MLSDKQILKLLNDADEGQEPSEYGVAVIRATEAAATAPLLARIAEQAMQLVSAQAQAQENHERAERLEKNAWAEITRLSTENAHLEAALAEASKDADRWKMFLSTRPPSTHNVICAAIDDAMKGQP